MSSVENPSLELNLPYRTRRTVTRDAYIDTYISAMDTFASNSERSIRQPYRMYTQKPLLFARIFDYDPLVEPAPF
ncbi:MAG: hypothetical protein GY820_18795 [Gammaproteobacteria bacterium]|nr:hypothetical protein [Gammaproteobacteria bacterium]